MHAWLKKQISDVFDTYIELFTKAIILGIASPEFYSMKIILSKENSNVKAKQEFTLKTKLFSIPKTNISVFFLHN